MLHGSFGQEHLAVIEGILFTLFRFNGCLLLHCDRRFLLWWSFHDGADLLERYKYFRQYGKDALLLTVLAYNVGHSRLLGYGKRPKSNLIKKIESGDRDIYEEYISYRCYKGKPIPSIERRRKREFQLLYIP